MQTLRPGAVPSGRPLLSLLWHEEDPHCGELSTEGQREAEDLSSESCPLQGESAAYRGRKVRTVQEFDLTVREERPAPQETKVEAILERER